ncbi:hypothetical protein FB45DRAFT_204767 [Roridomyces roridus]|uniref:Uncharacterized protein n=1 Tax=Roridomyces roridus TaxID=1738132 RepID=A0AAD7FZH0_9AGAR|nr:hypothetical protein FB45DRAFT_204767 [Roridomyces roridus]
MKMPGGLSTPPASPGMKLSEAEMTETPPKIAISTTPMQTSLTSSLSCATRLSPSKTEISLVLTPELLAVGELVAAMQGVVSALGTTFDCLGTQSERVATLAPALKASQQIRKLRSEIAEQINEQEARMASVKLLLEEAVKQALSEDIKAHIRERVGREVPERVAQQLSTQIPEHLRQQTKIHKRQIFEVQRSLHNSEARQHNSALNSTTLQTELRPLLRPLPSADQSVPPTPIPNLDDAPPTASPLFPRDLKALFALKPEEAQTLVTEYGLTEQALPITPLPCSTEADGARERNLNKFMAHIGVSRCRAANSQLPRLRVIIPGRELSVTTYY